VGQSVVVGGTTTDIVAIAGDGLQAELWIGASDHLPRMIRVTYTNEPAHAHYQTDYSDWQLGAAVDATAFKSDKAANAARMAFQPPPLSPPPEALMRAIHFSAGAALALGLAVHPASAWFHGGGGFHGFSGGGFHGFSGASSFHGWSGGSCHSDAGGGETHSGDLGGWQHSTTVSSEGVAHTSDVGGYEHGTAANSYGAYHASDAGGYYHSTGDSGGTVEHNGWNGNTTYSHGDYYHQPTTVNYYGGSGCWNCGSGWGYGAAALTGAAVGTAVGAAAASANTSNAYAAGVAAGAAAAAPATFAALPGGCSYYPSYGQPYYYCAGGGGYWLKPYYGANGVYYERVATP
jgi:hypothetical protein